MQSTLSCITQSGRQQASSRVCFSPAANNSTLSCVATVRKRTYINLIDINLLGQTGHTLNCETRCFEANNLATICYPPKERKTTDILMTYNVASRSSLHKISLFIGNIPKTQKEVSYEAISEAQDLPCYVHLGDNVSTTINCQYIVYKQSEYNKYILDVGYTTAGTLRCITQGESFTQRNCYVHTNTKVSTVDCIMHESVNPDDSSQIDCLCYRIAGATAQVQPLQVIGGYRHIFDLGCVLNLPDPSIYDVLCCNHGAIDGDPTYSTLRSGEYITLNIYNIGAREVTSASLKQRGTDIPAETISFNNNLWVVKFNLDGVSLGSDYFLTVKLANIDRMLILDAVKGKLNLGY